jgi:ribonuclease P protein component
LRQTFSRARRIGRAEGFNLGAGNRVIANGWFVLYARENGLGVSRLGIIVSKRTARLAHARNYAKRVIRETFRRQFAERCALDVVIRVRRQFDKEIAAKVTEALLQLLREAEAGCAG